VGTGLQTQYGRHARSTVTGDYRASAQGRAKVRAYDPVASQEAKRIYGDCADLVLCKNAYEAAQGADALAIVTEWQEFRSPDFERLKQILKAPVIFDGRNLYDPAMVSRFGFTYYAIGRGARIAKA
jgi:UDPglucose 6-dehydrogenase